MPGPSTSAVGFDRFLLDRLRLDDEAPMRREAGRVGEALGRVAPHIDVTARNRPVRPR